MLLTEVEVGIEAVITKSLESDKDTKAHLEKLGFLPGEKIVALARNKGNVLIKIHNSRFALNEDLAKSIIVEVLS